MLMILSSPEVLLMPLHLSLKILHPHFALKDLGSLHYFLGIETSWIRDGNIHLSQTKYIKDILHKANMLGSKSQPTSMVSLLCLTQYCTTVLDSSLYHSFVESLQYLTITHLDLAYSINKVCQYMHNP